MSVSSLTYADFSKILYQFDQRKFGSDIPTAEERRDRQLALNGLPRFFAEVKFPNVMTEKVAHYLTNNVTDLFLFYRQSPALSNRVNQINSNNPFLEKAALALLDLLNINPPADRGDLAVFKTLMSHILEDHLQQLTPDEQFSLTSQILGTTLQKEDYDSYITKLDLWNKTKFFLQSTSWKAQLLASRILQSKHFILGLQLAIFLVWAYIYIFTDFFKKIQDYLGSPLFSVIESYAGLFLSKELMKKNGAEVSLKDLAKMVPVMLSLFSIIGCTVMCTAYLYRSVKNHLPPQVIYALEIIPPGMLQLLQFNNLPSTLNRHALNWSSHLAVAMSDAQIKAAKTAYVASHHAAILDKWHTLSIEPHLLKV